MNIRTCVVGPCDNPRLEGNEYCAQHIKAAGKPRTGFFAPSCKVPSCTKAQADGSIYCAKHAANANLVGDPVNKEGRAASPGIVCPHCGTQGKVITRPVKQKRGISGGKATGAIMTGGISMFATGLSRKEKVTELTCRACRMTWHVA